jgi:alkylation response protein AidB-like acyl-CoA dehydrogenase
VNFRYSDDQRAMEEVMDRVFMDLDGVSMTRRAYSGHPLDRAEMAAVSQVLAEQGLFGTFVSEEYGGSGVELLDVVRVVARAGARLLPYPLAATLTVLWGLAQFGTVEQKARWLPAMADGSAVPTLAVDALLAPIDLTGEGQQLSARGGPLAVPHPDTATLIAIPARTPSGPGLLILDRGDLTLEPQGVWDLAEPSGSLALGGQPVATDRFVAFPADGYADLIALCRILAAADLNGVMQEALSRTVDYIKTRRQFGGPIGRFQALKHTAAGDHVRIVNTELALRFAALAFTNRHPARAFYASLVKAYAGEHGVTVTEDGVHLHGGMGFTWDADLHLFLKRAWRLSAVGGSAARCRREMAEFAFEPGGTVKTGALTLLA